TVTLSAPSANTVTVAVKTVNGTATAGTDFQALSTSVTFAPGTTTQTVSVTLLGRALGKVNKSFTVVLATPAGATLGATTSTVTITGTTAQLAAGVAPPGSVAAPLTSGALQPVVAAAEQDWVAAGADPRALAGVSFVITTLPLGLIGYTVGNIVYIDATAAGFGWYTGLNRGFDQVGVALAGGAAAGRMDLLTVVLHEIGHTVGLPDGCACGPYSALMQTTLAAGERRLLPIGSAPPVFISAATGGNPTSGEATLTLRPRQPPRRRVRVGHAARGHRARPV
ncbi:MAG: large repetitive protein, partial [Thermoleophilaceae bacterium]|nr:large repetitive protein [Thermoleophilaceae bacterium]